MKKVIVIGSGISGLSIAHQLKDKMDVTLIEKENRVGGLIKCKRVDGFLYHTVGGHVFNSKRVDVIDWFKTFFSLDDDFLKTQRNATIFFNNSFNIGYPIENNLFNLDKEITTKVISEILTTYKDSENHKYNNFEEFLIINFGKTLYEIYFKPYNAKIWNKSLKEIPISWLDGKLPMPNVKDIILSNIFREKENCFVHSEFYYEKVDGSQFIADKLASDLNIINNEEIKSLKHENGIWIVNNKYKSEKVIFTGNLIDLPKIVSNDYLNKYEDEISMLSYHGTTTVLATIDKNDYSWCYLPNDEYKPHRIICTGNFSESNNCNGLLSATIEFTDYVDEETISNDIEKLPLNPKYITHEYTKYTYPIQNKQTRDLINNIRNDLMSKNLFLLGRFAEWEYYNMDTAMGAAIDLSKKILDE